MNRTTQEAAKRKLRNNTYDKSLEPILKAAAEGKTIQYRSIDGWEDSLYLTFTEYASSYRIKPPQLNPEIKELWVNALRPQNTERTQTFQELVAWATWQVILAHTHRLSLEQVMHDVCVTVNAWKKPE